MKKYLSFLFVFMLLFAGFKTTRADDGGPNTDFWVIDKKTNCISITNPEIAGSNAFFVFDYSPKIGQGLGRPWVIVEKSKCYEIDDEYEQIYLVKNITGNEREVFSNYSNYKPTDDISQIFCFGDIDCAKTTIGSSFSRVESYYFDIAVTVDFPEEVHFTGINTNALFPAKFDFGTPVTSFISTRSKEEEQMAKYPAFVNASNLYISLAKQLNSSLQSCDTRVRVERQATINFEGNSYVWNVKNVVWRLANNVDTVVIKEYQPKVEDQLHNLEIMGCKTVFSSFIKSHQQDFTAVDSFAQEVITKFPKALGVSPYAMINNRDIADIDKIIAFVNSSNSTSAVTKPAQTPQDFTPTVLDEPTVEKKTDMLVNSANPLIRLYVWLPILALLGMLIFLVNKKK